MEENKRTKPGFSPTPTFLDVLGWKIEAEFFWEEK